MSNRRFYCIQIYIVISTRKCLTDVQLHEEITQGGHFFGYENENYTDSISIPRKRRDGCCARVYFRGGLEYFTKWLYRRIVFTYVYTYVYRVHHIHRRGLERVNVLRREDQPFRDQVDVLLSNLRRRDRVVLRVELAGQRFRARDRDEFLPKPKVPLLLFVSLGVKSQFHGIHGRSILRIFSQLFLSFFFFTED